MEKGMRWFDCATSTISFQTSRGQLRKPCLVQFALKESLLSRGEFLAEGVKIQQILFQCFMFQAVQSLLWCSSFNAENHKNRTHKLQQKSANNIYLLSICSIIALQSVGAMLQWTLQKPQFVEITRPNRTITSSRTSPSNGQFLWDLLSPSRKSIKSKLQLVIWSWCFGLAFRLCHFSSKWERDTFSNWA